MERKEQEQIADLITERITAVVKQTLLEERSVFINQINSHFAETLKSYFEEQLAIQRQEFEVELQTKIDELKFQHYQQLERLGQAVEQVMSANPDDDMDDEVDEQIYDSYVEEESELFADAELMHLIPEINLNALHTLESEFSDENLNLFEQDEKVVNDQIENPLEESEQNLITNQELNLLTETASGENDDSSLISAVSEVIPNLASPQTLESLETFDPFSIIDQDFEDLDSEISGFESLAGNEVNPEDELDFSEPESLKISEEPSLFDLGFDLSDDSEQLLEPDLESELDIFDQAEETEEFDSIGLSTESELFTESVSLDDLSDSLNLETLENDQNIVISDLESPKEEQEFLEVSAPEVSDPFDDLVPDLSYAESPEANEFEGDFTEADLGSWQFLKAIAQAEINTNQAIDNFNQEDLELNNEIDQIDPIEAQNPEPVPPFLSLDDELNQFAEIASLEDFGDVLTLESDNQELEFTDEFEAPDPFVINDEELNNFASLELGEEFGQIEADQDFLIDTLESDLPNPSESSPPIDDQELSDPFSLLTSDESLDSAESPEIVYEGEESNFEIDAELSDSDRLNLELEQELRAFETAEINIPEFQDQDLTKFADLEAVEDFWADDDHPESTITTPSTFRDLWHLGIDFGYSAFRACLFNQGTGKTYPLTFTGETQITANIKKENDKEAIALQGFKQFLRLGIPYQSEDTSENKWQPQVKWSNNQSYSLKDFQIPAQEILTQIKHTASHSELDSISEILENLETVILGHPHSWSDAYIFNLKEIVLASGLVSSIDQVLVIDQAIALISGCESSLEFSSNDQQLFMDSGALTTTLAFCGQGEKKFVDLEYAGLGIDQDIVLQLLYPQTKDKFPATKFIKAGEPNPTHRSNVQQFLSKTAIGLEALALAAEIKLFFSQNPASTLWQGNLGGKAMKVSSLDLEVKVIQPFIQSLNDAIEQMIAGITLPEAITGIVITGGTALLPAIHQWLESKFANAQVVELPNSNLAQGLAIAPTYAEDLDINRHQYSDYFLLSEICALNLQESVSLEQLIKKLQNRGVNAKSCSDRLAQILLGQLPAGVLPWQEPEKSLILPDPNLNLQLLTNRLFTPVSNNIYAPNPDYVQILGSYLHTLESSSNQNFTEPLVFPSFAMTS